MDYSGRLRRLRSQLEPSRLDWLLVTHLPNVRYLCGFTGSAAALIVADGTCVLFTDSRYRLQAKEELKAANADGVRLIVTREAPPLAAANWLATTTNGKCNIVELQGTVGASVAIDRKKGFEQGVGKHL